MLRKIDGILNRPTRASQTPTIKKLQPVWTAEAGHDLDGLMKALEEGRFEFLGQEHCYPDTIDWDDPAVSHLWRYHLHYFGYLEHVAAWAKTGERSRAFALFRRLVDSWIGHHQRIAGDGWHPYTLSLRLVNWIQACCVFRDELEADPEFRDRLLRSMWRQGEILYRDREFDVRGNHVLENLRALIWLGTFFDGPIAERWLQSSWSVLEAETAEQVLADGGHFERSPGYHLLVMKDLIEISELCSRNDRPVPSWLQAAIERMERYATAITTPTGRVPLLKDTALDAAPEAPEAANEYGSRLLEASGHYVQRDSDRGHFLIMDVGRVCPDYLPAHAHADMLSYELFVSGLPLVVDSGVYEYTAGEWRNYFRSTRAHNTVCLAGENQSEVWGSFRVARRARLHGLVHGDCEDHHWCRARHDGYRRIGAGDHERTLIWLRPDAWLIVDRVSDPQRRQFENIIHLHPDVSATRQDDGSYRWEHGKESGRVVGFGHDTDECHQGTVAKTHRSWYSERFGVKRENPAVTFTGVADESLSGYAIVVGNDVPAIRPADGSVNVEIGDRIYEINLLADRIEVRLKQT